MLKLSINKLHMTDNTILRKIIKSIKQLTRDLKQLQREPIIGASAHL